MIKRTRIALTAATALTLASGVALAQNSSQDSTSGSSSMMSIAKTVEMLEGKGYTDIDSIDRELDRYDVDATAPSGQRVEITVDGKTGEVLRSERDDD
ncbi:PepSY domain-containing protein [Salinisphaera aquimarina]|uniref:PepSY domain-containing protein n=1 Tax=Salinisphaera aquimarina TaxID=2094031 RepID=A0ABV7ETU7_9GAMM